MNIKHWVLFHYAADMMFYAIRRARSIGIRFKRKTIHDMYDTRLQIIRISYV